MEDKEAPDVRDKMVSYSNLYRMKRFLQDLSPGFVGITVMNPQLEWIMIETRVLFGQGYNSGFYIRLLNDEINDFYAPWLKDPEKAISLGGSALKGDLVAFISSRYYVKHLKTIKMTLLNDVGQVIEDDLDHVLASTTPWSLMVPSPTHKIKSVSDPDYEFQATQQFDWLRQVMALEDTSIEGRGDKLRARNTPDELIMVVSKRLAEQKEHHSLEEMLVSEQQCLDVAKYLEEVAPTMRKVSVINPKLEYIQVEMTATVYPNSQLDEVYAQLNADIYSFYTEWLGDNKKTFVLGGIALRKDLMAYLKARPYLRHINYLRLYLLNAEGELLGEEEDKKLSGTTIWSLLVPASHHELNLTVAER